MPYYEGDFYPGRQGDFYRGDPGLFSFLGRAAKSLVSFIPGVGPIASKAISATEAIVKRPSVTSGATSQLARAGALVKGTAAQIGRVATKHPIISAAAGAGVIGAMGAGISAVRGRGAAGAGMRRHRKMNPCNPRALRRAIRRTHRFAKLAMKTIHLVHPRKKVRFGGFKKRRRAAA